MNDWNNLLWSNYIQFLEHFPVNPYWISDQIIKLMQNFGRL